MYIISSQNWEHMGNHYWIKQCLELLLNVVQPDQRMICSSIYSRLPSCVSVLNQSTNTQAQEISRKCKIEKDVIVDVKTMGDEVFDANIKIKTEPDDDYESMELNGDAKDSADVFLPKYFSLTKDSKEILAKLKNKEVVVVNENEEDYDSLLTQLAEKHGSFLKQLSEVTVGPFVHAVSQLSHRSTLLAHKIWIDMFPHIWELLDEKHHMILSGELGPFLSSGSHLAQTEGYRSAINTLVEGMSRCDPPVPIRPVVLKYLGKTHNLWHQAALMLENMAVACDDMVSVNPQLPLQQPWLDFGKQILLYHLFLLLKL